MILYDEVIVPNGKLWKRFGPLHVLLQKSSIFWHSKSLQDAKKTWMIVLYYFRRHRSAHVNKLNRYWIGTSYQRGNRRMPKASKTLWTDFLGEKPDHAI